MKFLRTNFTRYRWWLLLAAGVGGALSGGQVLDSLPPGTDLLGALIALYAMARNEREAGSTAVADKVAERLWKQLGAQEQRHDLLAARVGGLAKVAHDHADKIDHVAAWALAGHGYMSSGAAARP